MTAMVETFGLSKKFNGLKAVHELTLQIEKGEVLGFLGPNGAGKTTTIRMLSGIIAPTSGYATVTGKPVSSEVEQLHELIGLLTEMPGFYERLSALDNLRYFAKFYSKIDYDKQIDKYLKIIGLWERRNDKVATFSKGMKQKLALARALIHEPEVLFFDEPTTGLDPEASKEVRILIKRLKQEGRTIFLCTHNLKEAEQLCDRIAVFKTYLITVDTPENLRNRLFTREVVCELSRVNKKIIDRLKKLDFVRKVKEEGSKIFVELKDIKKNRPDLITNIVKSGGKIESFYENTHSLEEIYFTLLSEEGKK